VISFLFRGTGQQVCFYRCIFCARKQAECINKFFTWFKDNLFSQLYRFYFRNWGKIVLEDSDLKNCSLTELKAAIEGFKLAKSQGLKKFQFFYKFFPNFNLIKGKGNCLHKKTVSSCWILLQELVKDRIDEAASNFFVGMKFLGMYPAAWWLDWWKFVHGREESRCGASRYFR